MPDFTALLVSIWEKLESKRHALALILIPSYWVLLAYIFFVYKFAFLEEFYLLKYAVIVAAGVGLGALSTNFVLYISSLITKRRANQIAAKQMIVDKASAEAEKTAALKRFKAGFLSYYYHFTPPQVDLIRELCIEDSISLKNSSEWVRNLSHGKWIVPVAYISHTATAFRLNRYIKELVISLWDEEIENNINSLFTKRTEEIDDILSYFEKTGTSADDEVIETSFIAYPMRDVILLCFQKRYESSHQLTLRIKDKYQSKLEEKLGKKLIHERTFSFKN